MNSVSDDIDTFLISPKDKVDGPPSGLTLDLPDVPEGFLEGALKEAPTTKNVANPTNPTMLDLNFPTLTDLSKWEEERENQRANRTC